MAIFFGMDLSWVSGIFSFLIYFVVIIIGASIALLMGLYGLRNSRLIYPVLIYRKISDGRGCFELTKAGKFKRRKMIFGLLDIGGEKELMTKDGRKIQDYSDNDLIDISFKKGFLVTQSPMDEKILCPISKTKLDDRDLFFDIPNADMRTAALDSISSTETEMIKGWEKILPLIAPVMCALIMLVAIMATIQFSQHQYDAAIKGAKEILETVRNVATAVPSVTP
jgi:hypothetical protein